MDDCSLDRGEEALARSRLYSLFRALYSNGVTGDLLPIIQAVPELAVHLPTPVDEDSLAAAHQTLFGFNLFPYESIFLSSTGELGGEDSEAVSMAYRAVGYQPTGWAKNWVCWPISARPRLIAGLIIEQILPDECNASSNTFFRITCCVGWHHVRWQFSIMIIHSSPKPQRSW